jgi:hypothetical protein
MDENGGVIQKKGGSVRPPIKTSKKHETGFHSFVNHKDAWWTIDHVKLNFIKMQKEKMYTPFVHPWDMMIFSYTFFQSIREDKPFSHQNVTDKSTVSAGSGPIILKSFSDENKYYGGEGWMTTYKLLEAKRREILKEIFVGFHLSFDMKNRHLLFDISATPETEKRSGIIIPF